MSLLSDDNELNVFSKFMEQKQQESEGGVIVDTSANTNEHDDSKARVPILIPDHTELRLPSTNSNNDFVYPPEYEGHLEGVLIPFNDIIDRIRVLARVIGSEYRGKRPMIVCVLKGASVFYNNLLLALSQQRITYSMEFLRAKCTINDSTSSGQVEISGLDLTKVQNRHIILVDDAVITGGTLSHVIAVMKAAGCASIKVCALLNKRIPVEKRLKQVDFVGFSVPNLFLVGHGLDYADSYRECADIWVVSNLGKEKKGKT